MGPDHVRRRHRRRPLYCGRRGSRQRNCDHGHGNHHAVRAGLERDGDDLGGTDGQPPAGSAVAFGSFDSPAHNASNLSGAIAVTGWALDNVGVAKVQLWRNCVETIDRPANACASAVPGGPPTSSSSPMPRSSRAPRGVLRDVGRVLQMPYGQVDKLCKLVPQNPAAPVSLKQAIDGEPESRQSGISRCG